MSTGKRNDPVERGKNDPVGEQGAFLDECP